MKKILLVAIMMGIVTGSLNVAPAPDQQQQQQQPQQPAGQQQQQQQQQPVGQQGTFAGVAGKLFGAISSELIKDGIRNELRLPPQPPFGIPPVGVPPPSAYGATPPFGAPPNINMVQQQIPPNPNQIQQQQNFAVQQQPIFAPPLLQQNVPAPDAAMVAAQYAQPAVLQQAPQANDIQQQVPSIQQSQPSEVIQQFQPPAPAYQPFNIIQSQLPTQPILTMPPAPIQQQFPQQQVDFTAGTAQNGMPLYNPLMTGGNPFNYVPPTATCNQGVTRFDPKQLQELADALVNVLVPKQVNPALIQPRPIRAYNSVHHNMPHRNIDAYSSVHHGMPQQNIDTYSSVHHGMPQPNIDAYSSVHHGVPQQNRYSHDVMTSNYVPVEYPQKLKYDCIDGRLKHRRFPDYSMGLDFNL